MEGSSPRYDARIQRRVDQTTGSSKVETPRPINALDCQTHMVTVLVEQLRTSTQAIRQTVDQLPEDKPNTDSIRFNASYQICKNQFLEEIARNSMSVVKEIHRALTNCLTQNDLQSAVGIHLVRLRILI